MRKRELAHLSDERLVAMLSDDNELAFSELFDRYWLSLLDRGLKVLNGQEAAQDCVQEVFLDLWTKRHSLQINHLGAYLHQSVKYKVIDHIRRARVPLTNLDYVGHLVSERGTEEMLDYQELHDFLDQSVSELPTQCQRIFRMSRFDHLSNKEIAAKLNLSVRTVENHIANAIKSLRLRLDNVSPALLILLLY